MATTPTTASVAAKVAKLRAAAKDTSIPQDVRNQYLDKANALERSTYSPTMAKGGAVKKPMAKKYAVGGDVPASMQADQLAKAQMQRTPAVASMQADQLAKAQMQADQLAKAQRQRTPAVARTPVGAVRSLGRQPSMMPNVAAAVPQAPAVARTPVGAVRSLGRQPSMVPNMSAPTQRTPAVARMPMPMMAKGGTVAKPMAKAPAKPMAKKPASKGAAVAIVIGVGKPKKPMMAKGGVAKAPAKKGY